MIRRTFCQPFTLESMVKYVKLSLQFPKGLWWKEQLQLPSAPQFRIGMTLWQEDFGRKIQRLIPSTCRPMPFQNIPPKVWTPQNVTHLFFFSCGKSWYKAVSAPNGSTAANSTGQVCFLRMEFYGRIAVILTYSRAQSTDPEITDMHDFLTSLHEMHNLACEPISKYTAV